MPVAQMHNTSVPSPNCKKMNIYRNAEVSGEITIGFNPAFVFGYHDVLQTLSTAMVEQENLLVDMLVKAGVISHSQAASALATSPELPVINYLKSFCFKSDAACKGFSNLAQKVSNGKLSLNQAAVAANHLNTTNATFAEAIRLVRWAG